VHPAPSRCLHQANHLKLRTLAEAYTARDEAVAQVERNADQEWMAEAKRALWQMIRLIGLDGYLTTDDVDAASRTSLAHGGR
jgi:hypothetical protein